MYSASVFEKVISDRHGPLWPKTPISLHRANGPEPGPAVSLCQTLVCVTFQTIPNRNMNAIVHLCCCKRPEPREHYRAEEKPKLYGKCVDSAGSYLVSIVNNVTSSLNEVADKESRRVKRGGGSGLVRSRKSIFSR